MQSVLIDVIVMAYEWQGQRLYMIGYNSESLKYEMWRTPVAYAKGMELVFQEMSDELVGVKQMVVNPFGG